MKNAGKACNNRLYRHIRTFEKIVKNYFVISAYTKKQMLSVLNDFKLNKEYRKKMRDFKKENVNLINSVLKNNNTYIKDLTKKYQCYRK